MVWEREATDSTATAFSTAQCFQLPHTAFDMKCRHEDMEAAV